MVTESGDLVNGELNLSEGLFDYTLSQRKEQETYSISAGMNFDEEGDHKIDVTLFFTDKNQEFVEALEYGKIPSRNGVSFFDGVTLDGLEYQSNANGLNRISTLSSWIAFPRENSNLRLDPRSGQAWFSPTFESTSFLFERDLLIAQLNGSHRFDFLNEDLNLNWAANTAETSQYEEAIGIRYYYEPDTIYQKKSFIRKVE